MEREKKQNKKNIPVDIFVCSIFIENTICIFFLYSSNVFHCTVSMYKGIIILSNIYPEDLNKYRRGDDAKQKKIQIYVLLLNYKIRKKLNMNSLSNYIL